MGEGKKTVGRRKGAEEVSQKRMGNLRKNMGDGESRIMEGAE